MEDSPKTAADQTFRVLRVPDLRSVRHTFPDTLTRSRLARSTLTAYLSAFREDMGSLSPDGEQLQPHPPWARSCCSCSGRWNHFELSPCICLVTPRSSSNADHTPTAGWSFCYLSADAMARHVAQYMFRCTLVPLQAVISIGCRCRSNDPTAVGTSMSMPAPDQRCRAGTWWPLDHQPDAV